MTEINSNLVIQFVFCTTACVGFAMWFNVRGKQIVFCGIGACCTWGVYILADMLTHNYFFGTMIAAIFVAGYAQIMARVNKAPATIFQSVCAFPLIPGNNLYFMMYAAVMDMPAQARSEGKQLILNCLGLALGFMVIEIVNKYSVLLYKLMKEKVCPKN